ncbi:hypothetical protein RLO149_c008240 [Roseobacter litoralis Och 149]|uniref:Uncharacterized protein n=1 Tax=Roseobacter litoralis (strain ATCC 49566 / DSM 6996 / JCM 21268 / NBRC 15278 / OCh 149) TaxID=391595 RepID=F7ZLJ1_ROSLO|nr:hypothetical protein RLO149_c008240 [Roseobacter litoralis Och 149]
MIPAVGDLLVTVNAFMFSLLASLALFAFI